MQKKFLANLSFLMLLNIIIKPAWIFGIDMQVQNTVGAEAYGYYFTLFNFSFLFNILFDLGITNFNNRNIAQNSQLLNKHFSSILILKFLLGVLYFVVTFVAALIWGFRGEALHMLLFLGINQFLISFILYLRSNISALLLFKTESVMSVLDRIMMIAICSVLLWGGVAGEFRIEWFVYAQTVAYFITFLVAFIIVLKKASFRRLNWNYPFFLMILKQSLPFAVLVLLMAFYSKIDTVMIMKLIQGSEGKIQVGIYAHSYRLLDAANSMTYLVSVLLLPMFARQLKAKENVGRLVKLSFSILFVVSVVVSVVSFAFRTEIIGLLYKHYIAESAALFPILMSSLIAISTGYVFGTLLTANGNLKHLNLLALCGMVLNIVLNLVLIPKFGAYGSAWSSLVTQSIMAISQVILSILFFKLRVERNFLLRLLLFVGGVIALGFVADAAPVHWLISLTCLLLASVVVAAVLKLLNINHFKDIVKDRIVK